MEEISEGLGLSEQLSQVRLVAAATHPFDRVVQSLDDEDSRSGYFQQSITNPDDFGIRTSNVIGRRMDLEVDGDLGLDSICSQDFFCTPDFITPVEQQFSVDFDGNKEKRLVPPSPLSLTQVRSKRRRPDVLVLPPAVLADSRRELPGASPELASVLDEAEGFTSVVGDDFKESGDVGHVYSNSRVRLSTLRKRVQNPLCIQNPFMATGQEEGGCAREGRSNWEGHQSSGSGESSSRYRDDFEEIKEIGRGCFSRVYKVLHRVDGSLYAVKRTHHQLHQDSQRKQALLEVQALATIGSHPNVVRYHSAWFESGYLYTQMELCSCNLTELRAAGDLSSEDQLIDVLWEIAQAVALLFKHGLAHLDIKPDNIYVRDGVYKLGDFGRASRLDGTMDIEEGDSRYTPLELLNDEHSELHKADIFALGATMYELARGLPLPSSGVQFQALRQGKLALLPGFSLPFQQLLKEMMNPVASLRPTAAAIIHHIVLKSRKESILN